MMGTLTSLYDRWAAVAHEYRVCCPLRVSIVCIIGDIPACAAPANRQSGSLKGPPVRDNTENNHRTGKIHNSIRSVPITLSLCPLRIIALSACTP